ncbi:imidazole glycerol phosphate synthase subunit HisF [Aureibacter tunicatorum]|uniref:Imidazole glycerol phosphate synthase subunit HisF n=1 Tax=Aureibacter tunicatorum TaxID=866807 RepID=A0AAE4BSV1_9BACT|nr:imidazole glycerol phosphate synthase subunit HisF [Aureibacter tunicatorum]MDR6239203.1 cyclase [Aureibacter tunicatorum]BDD04871.1 imidazole glycerol phosphate synthase subunit HisF [Aureibacter tunicatorum]
MLTKRIIPCLDIKDGRTVKGVNFVELRDAGDPVELAKAYAEQGADELVFLDITATVENRKTLVDLVRKIAKEINIPFTVGGGISSVEDVSAMLNAGADKIAINSAAVKNPYLINELASQFGSQCVVVAVDTKFVHGLHTVHVHGGRTSAEIDTIGWCIECQNRGAGEILLTSMDHDGTKNGFASELTSEISTQLSIPVIASGGAGSMDHFADVFTKGKADAGLAASIFHFNEIGIPELKDYLRDKQIEVRI